MRDFNFFIAFVLLTSFTGYSQICKLKVENSKNAYFYDLELDWNECQEDVQDFYYKWNGSVKNGLLDGIGELKTYDAQNKKLLSVEQLEFIEGYRNGMGKENEKNKSKESTTYHYYQMGKLIKTQREYENSFYSIKAYIDYTTGNFTYLLKGKQSGDSKLLYSGIYDFSKKTFEGTLLINDQLSEKGTFKPMHLSELDLSFPLYYHSVCFIQSGTKYFSNGVSVTADKFAGNYPSGCATIKYPNGDKLFSCDFNGSISVSGQGRYYWADGRKYVGEIIDSKITSNGEFVDKNGNRNFGNFPNVKKEEDALLGVATLGLIVYGIYELITPEKQQVNKSETNLQTPTVSYSTTPDFQGSIAAYNDSQKEHKCYKCNGRGVCISCNGRGQNVCWKCEGEGIYGASMNIIGQSLDNTCTSCNGKGYSQCYSCYGSGSCSSCQGKGIN